MTDSVVNVDTLEFGGRGDAPELNDGERFDRLVEELREDGWAEASADFLVPGDRVGLNLTLMDTSLAEQHYVGGQLVTGVVHGSKDTGTDMICIRLDDGLPTDVYTRSFTDPDLLLPISDRVAPTLQPGMQYFYDFYIEQPAPTAEAV